MSGQPLVPEFEEGEMSKEQEYLPLLRAIKNLTFLPWQDKEALQWAIDKLSSKPKKESQDIDTTKRVCTCKNVVASQLFFLGVNVYCSECGKYYGSIKDTNIHECSSKPKFVRDVYNFPSKRTENCTKDELGAGWKDGWNYALEQIGSLPLPPPDPIFITNHKERIKHFDECECPICKGLNPEDTAIPKNKKNELVELDKSKLEIFIDGLIGDDCKAKWLAAAISKRFGVGVKQLTIPSVETIENLLETNWNHLFSPEENYIGRLSLSRALHNLFSNSKDKGVDKLDSERLDWLDLHTSFVADGEYVIGPYKIGQLRQMADDGIAIDKAKKC